MGRNIVEIIIKADDKASAQLKAIAANTKNLGQAFSAAGTLMVAGGLAIEGALAGVIMKTSAWADGLHDVSERLGISTEFLSQMEYALGVTGGEIGNFQIGMKLLAGTLQDAINGDETATKKFTALGISILDSSGKARSASQMFFILADRIAGAKTSTEAMAIATDFYGRNALTLVPLLKLGSAGIQDLMEKADKLGGTLSTEAADKADKFGDALVDVKTSLKGVGVALFDIYGDKLIQFSDELATGTIPKIKEWIEQNEKLAKSIPVVAGAAIALGLAAKSPMLALAVLTGAQSVEQFALLKSAIASVKGELTAEAGVPEWLKAWFNYVTTGPRLLREMAGLNHKTLTDEAEDGDAAAAAWDRYQDSLKKTAAPAALSFRQEMETIYALYPKKPDPIEMTLLSCARATDIWDAKTMDLAGHIIAVTGAYEKVAVPAMVNPFADEWQAGLDEFDIRGIDVARDLTQEFGGMFSQIAQKGANAAEIFDQAWRSAIGNVAARLAEMAIWKVGASILGTVLGFIPFLSGGGEVKGAASGLEAFGGTRGRDTIPTMIASGEVVMPSPTVNRLKAFLDRAEGSLQGAVNVYPLFFSGSRQDSQLAAEYIQRRLDGNSRFVIEGSL